MYFDPIEEGSANDVQLMGWCYWCNGCIGCQGCDGCRGAARK